ncbi:hypothetical protein GVX81_02620 [[Haemophilus] felis]|uniref:Bro-N domain-containing protein n=1 Tax=[Haemophilus] felis TaxID=123822 RepID=A0A1T0B226_9PAST|nr:hypothetical protein [[Haemophilus] felis]OOS04132.1 hypothetical protein B0188_05560 [[Haemophilus] felis]
MTTLTFQNTTLSVINQNNQTWLSVTDIAKALGYKETNGVIRLYNAHADEFTPCMTALIDMQTAGGMQKVRIFSLRGCHLIGMLSHTKVAKDFRRWVLDILDRETHQPKQLELPKPEKRYTVELTEHEINQLAWLLFSHKQMNDLLGDLLKPLEAIGSRYSAMVYSHHYEYKNHYNACLKCIKRMIEPFKHNQDISWTRVNRHLNKPNF